MTFSVESLFIFFVSKWTTVEKIGFKTSNYGTGQHQNDVGERSRPTIGGFWTEW